MRDIKLEVMRQEAEAEVRKTRRIVLDELCGNCFELSLLPAWTPRLLQRLNYNSDPTWLEALVDRGFCYKKAARRVWRQATPAVPEYAVYEVTEQWRTWVLDMVVHDEHHQLYKLRDQMSTLATAIQPVIAEDPRAVPEATRTWTLLAWQTYVEGFQQTLHAHVDDALADNQSHRAMAFVTCARRMLPYLEPRAALVVEGAARRLEVTRRRQADADKLRHYLVRQTQVKAFHAVLDDPDTWALHFLGMGGMGKTMLLRYLLSERQPGRDYIAARIDFDFLDPDYPTRSPGLLLEALGEELRVQDTEGHTGTLFTTLSNEILGFHEVVQLDEAEGRHLCLAEHPRFDLVLSLFADMIRHLKKPVVFLLDTCEELVGTRVDGNRTRAVTDTFAIFEVLRTKKVDFTIVFAGRRLLAKAGFGWTIHPDQAPALPVRDYLRLFVLQPFSETEAGHYFESRAVAESRRDDLLRLCRTDVSLSLDGITEENAGVYYSPFDCALYCDWLEQEPDLDLSGAAEGEDRYVARRVVGRITDNTLKHWLPAMALLGRFDQATLTAFVDPIPEETAQVAWLDCTGLEWVNAEGAFLAVLDGLRGRLLRWFQRERPSAIAAAKTKLLEILGQAIAANPSGVDPEYVIDVIRLSDQKRLAQWWPGLRDVLVKDCQFERLQAIFRRLAVKTDQYGAEVPEPIALDSMLLEARDHAWDGSFNWLPFLENDETGRAFFAYLAQYSVVIDSFAERFFAATPQPLPSFEELKAALMVLGLRVAPPDKKQQPVASPGKVRLEAWRNRIPSDQSLAAAVLKACEAYLAWREGAVQHKTGNAYLQSLLEALENNSKDASLSLYAAFLRVRFQNIGRRRTTLRKELRCFLQRFNKSKMLQTEPDLYWSKARDLHPVIRYFVLRYYWQGVLNFEDIQSLLFEQHDSQAARFCSGFYFQAADSVSSRSAEFKNYPVELLPLQLQIPRDTTVPVFPFLALLARNALDAPRQQGVTVERRLAVLLEQSEANAEAAIIQHAIQFASQRLMRWFAPLPEELIDVLKNASLEFYQAPPLTELGLDWIHECWSFFSLPTTDTLLEKARQFFRIEDQSLGGSFLGLAVALDQVEFNRLAARFEVAPMPLDDVDWGRAIHTLSRQHPLRHAEIFRLMLRRWVLGLGRKPNMNRFKSRLGGRRLVMELIDLARLTALRLPDCAYLLYQTALELLPKFDQTKPTGLHLICYADMWYCRSMPYWEAPVEPELPEIDDLIPHYQYGGPIEAFSFMLAEVQHALNENVTRDDANSTLSFSLTEPVAPILIDCEAFTAKIRSQGGSKGSESQRHYTFSVEVQGKSVTFSLNLNGNETGKGLFSATWRYFHPDIRVVVLRLADVEASLPAWETAGALYAEEQMGLAWDRTYRRLRSKELRQRKQQLGSAMVMSGHAGSGVDPAMGKIWRPYTVLTEHLDVEILHLIGRPIRLGNGAFRLGLGDSGHRKEGDLLTPEMVGKDGPYALVLVQMPADTFSDWHRLECAYGRGFAGALVREGFADAVLFLPPFTSGLMRTLSYLVKGLVETYQGNWPNGLLHSVARLRQEISAYGGRDNAWHKSVAGQISLTTAFDIEVKP